MSKKDRQSTDEILNESSEAVEESVTEENTGQNDKSMEEKGEAQNVEKELEAQKDKYLRLAAEFDNFRKRTARETMEIRQTASRDLMVSLLEILDDVDRAEAQITESGEKNELLEGVLLVFNKFKKTLEQKGLKAIETLHTEFDVEKDEAISEVPVEDEALKGKVVAEVQKGYTLNDRLIRFAKVVVGK